MNVVPVSTMEPSPAANSVRKRVATAAVAAMPTPATKMESSFTYVDLGHSDGEEEEMVRHEGGGQIMLKWPQC